MDNTKEIYEGEYDNIVISIPTNTIEVNITVTVFDNSEITQYHAIYDNNTLYEMKQEYEENYCKYVITEEGMKYLDELENNR